VVQIRGDIERGNDDGDMHGRPPLDQEANATRAW
jgi:hypothetical protein